MNEHEHEMTEIDEPAGEHVLVVDDDPFIARLLEIELRAAGYDVRVAGDGVQALEAAQERCPDLVLADVMMPNMDGFELTRRLRQDARTASVSVIMLTARGLSADKLEGFSVGADDYIVKPFDTPELLARIRGVLRRAREMRAQSPLTGLPGNVRIEDEIESRVGADQPFAILYADLDHFKAFNDRHGHPAGDALLREAAREWTGLLRATDLLARYGGEEFALAFPAWRLDSALAVIDRLRPATPAGVTCSAGLVAWREGESAEQLIDRADAALYQAKRDGRDRTVTDT